MTTVKVVNFDEFVETQVIEGESLEFDLTVEELEERLEFTEGGAGSCCGFCCGSKLCR